VDQADRHLALIGAPVKKADELALVLPLTTDFVGQGKILALDLFGQQIQKGKELIPGSGRFGEHAFYGQA
jgi:hypothetical protein